LPVESVGAKGFEKALRETRVHNPLGIVWSFGTGMPGKGGKELYTPHIVEDLGIFSPSLKGKLLVAEQSNHDVVIIDKAKKELSLFFGERGVRGAGNRLFCPHAAHYIPSGPYKGDILIADHINDRVLIVDFETKSIVWECSIAGYIRPLDAIYWDDDHIMVSFLEPTNRIARIRLSDKSVDWSYSTVNPFYLQKLVRKGAEPGGYGNSYGGDLLFGSVDGYVREINTADSSTVWQFGSVWVTPDDSDVMGDRLWCPVRALRYGTGENETRSRSAITIIADEGSARILAVNFEREILWEIGGVSRLCYKPLSWLIEPTYVNVSENGNLLICDTMADRIYELVYPPYPPVIDNLKFTYRPLRLSSVAAGATTTLDNCAPIDTRRAKSLALTVTCTYDAAATAGIRVHIRTSVQPYDNYDTADYITQDMPFTAGQTVRSTLIPNISPRYLKVLVENLDTAHAVSNVSVDATIERGC
jgi:hypothetical protein